MTDEPKSKDRYDCSTDDAYIDLIIRLVVVFLIGVGFGVFICAVLVTILS